MYDIKTVERKKFETWAVSNGYWIGAPVEALWAAWQAALTPDVAIARTGNICEHGHNGRDCNVCNYMP